MTDKPFYENVERPILVSEETYDLTSGSRSIPSVIISENKEYQVKFDGQLYNLIATTHQVSMFGYNVLGNPHVASTTLADNGLPFAIYYSMGATKIAAKSAGSYTMALYGEPTTKVIHLDEKFLPESVESVVVRSSTADSAKKFKITVDDSGTISATEVT